MPSWRLPRPRTPPGEDDDIEVPLALGIMRCRREVQEQRRKHRDWTDNNPEPRTDPARDEAHDEPSRDGQPESVPLDQIPWVDPRRTPAEEGLKPLGRAARTVIVTWLHGDVEEPEEQTGD